MVVRPFILLRVQELSKLCLIGITQILWNIWLLLVAVVVAATMVAVAVVLEDFFPEQQH